MNAATMLVVPTNGCNRDREEEEHDVGGRRDADLADEGHGERPQPRPEAAEDEADDDRLDHQHGQDEAALGPMARRVPISRTRSRVAITSALLMMTRAMRKMMRMAT